MKKIIILSMVTSFVLAGNTVKDLVVDQVSDITSTSDIKNNATVSQAKTNIQNNSTVEDVFITQKDNGGVGNLIDDTTISGTNSEVSQGLTSVNDGVLSHAKLNSNNKIQRVDILGGKSVVTQANLVIGGKAKASGTDGGPWGGGVTEYIKITEENTLEDSTLNTSTVDQGLVTINDNADVSSPNFDLNQINTIKRVTTGNSVTSSKISQGVVDISGGDTDKIEQYTNNEISDVSLNSSTVKQSHMKFKDSVVSNVNTGNGTDIDDKNLIEDLTATNGSTITQSSMDINASTVLGLYKSEIGSVGKNLEYHNIIKDVNYLDNSNIEQSVVKATNGSTLINVTYKNSANVDNAAWANANNHIEDLSLGDSKLNQDVTELDNGNLKNVTIDRLNTVWDITATNNSTLNQNRVVVLNSTLENSTVKEDNLMYDLNMNHAALSQGSTIITD